MTLTREQILAMRPMKTPTGIELELRQQWKEVDPRFNRIVEVAGWNHYTGKVQLQCGSRLTWAKLSRFNGKRGGYERYYAAPEAICKAALLATL